MNDSKAKKYLASVQEDQLPISSTLLFASGEDSRQQILYLVAVGDEQITVGTVAARLIQRHRLHWVRMDEQRELTLMHAVCALRAIRKPCVFIGIEKEAIHWRLLSSPPSRWTQLGETPTMIRSILPYDEK